MAGRQLSRVVTTTVAVAALLAALLPSALAQSAAFSIEIRPSEPRDRAVSTNNSTTVTGQVPQGTITDARKVVTFVDGSTTSETVAGLNTVSPNGEFLLNAAGRLTGRLSTGSCLFAPPYGDCDHPETRRVHLEVTIGSATGRSNTLRVDYHRPKYYVTPALEGVLEFDRPRALRSHRLVDTEHILVRFTEPVRTDVDSPSDWEVTNPPAQVLAVEPAKEGDCVGWYPPGADPDLGDTGCTRTLVISPVDEDAQPHVEFQNPTTANYRESPYDYASNQLLVLNVVKPSVDWIRPPMPKIDLVAGNAPSERLAANQPRVPMRLSNVRAGHQVWAEARRGDTVVATSAKRNVGPAQTTVDVEVTLPDDGTYTLVGVAADPNGNLSSETAKRIATGRSDGTPNSVTYVLDRVAPLISSAVRTTARDIVVTFFDATSPAVEPAGTAGRWTIDGQTASAAGEGMTRTLTAPADLGPGDHVVRWQRLGTRCGEDEADRESYCDEAGNLLVEPGDIAVLPLPPVPVPTVLEPPPGADRFVTSSPVTVAGTVDGARSGLRVEVVDIGDGTVRGEADVNADGSWAARDVQLPSDGRYHLQARVLDTSSQIRSGVAVVPDIVLDSQAPAVDVTAPAAQPIRPGGSLDQRRRYAVGGRIDVAWTASDPAPEDDEDPDHTARSAVTLVPTGGNARLLETRPHGQGEQRLRYVVTPEDLGTAVERELRFTVETRDLAENSASDQSAPVLITSEIIAYNPVFIRPSSQSGTAQIEARFPVEMRGTTSNADWLIDNVPPARVDLRVEGNRSIVTLTATQPIPDPNASPVVQYQPSTLSVALPALRTADGKAVDDNPGTSEDGVVPALTANLPSRAPTTADHVTITGGTDASTWPNTVMALRANEDGSPTDQLLGEPVKADANGRYSLDVPLSPNSLNRVAIVAHDPSGNPSSPAYFEVMQDAVAPVVNITAPAADTAVSRDIKIRWETVDAFRDVVDLEYRKRGEDWVVFATGERDDGEYDWQMPEDLRDRDVVDLRVVAYDVARNRGEAVRVGLVLDLTGPLVERARATSERTIDVFFSERVALADDARFTVPGGPKVTSTALDGQKVTLTLADDLSTTEPEVAYEAGATDAIGNAAAAKRLRAERGFAFAVTGLVGVADRTAKVARLSWVDERNRREHITSYDVLVDGAPAGSTSAGVTNATQPLREGEHTYSIIAVDDRGNVSKPVDTAVRYRPDVPAGADEAPEAPEAPNITPAGGLVVSEDAQVVLTVPPLAVDRDYYGRLEQRPAARVAGYLADGAAYELVAEAADGSGELLRTFARFSCLSFRPNGGLAGVPERTTTLRTTDIGADEVATRVGTSSAEACFLTVAPFALAHVDGITTRVSGTEPALGRDRFSTAVSLSQTAFATASTAVIARADDYPDALAAAALAANAGGPVLLASTDALPHATVLELFRLGVRRVLIAGGNAAVGQPVVDGLTALGFDVERVAGDTRFHTAVAIAEEVGVVPGARRVYLATGRNFADALAASPGSAHLGRPILLTEPERLTDVTLEGMRRLQVTDVDVLGGTAAVSALVEQQLVAEGFNVRRIAGANRYETAAALFRALATEGLSADQPIAASGEGDGRTSPDALAAGPVAARHGSPVLLVPRDDLHPAIRDLLTSTAGVRGVVVAGGPAAVSPQTRMAIDATQG